MTVFLFIITVLHYQSLESDWFQGRPSAVRLDLRPLHLQLTRDSNFQLKETFWLNCHLRPLKTFVIIIIPLTTDLRPSLLFLWQMKSTTVL